MPDNQEEKIRERFVFVRKTLKLTQKEFAEKLGYKQGHISEMENGSKNISKAIFYPLEKNLNINIDWLEKGTGHVFNPDGGKIVKKGTPMFDSPSTASNVEVYGDFADEAAFYVNIPQFRDCAFGKIIYGHSMYPTYESGSYVFCKTISDLEDVSFGEVYLIETENRSIVKRLQRGKSDEYFLECSDNKELRPDGARRYEDQDLKKEKIRKLYLVKGSFKQAQN